MRWLEEPKRTTLEALRRTILELVPDAEQVISYRVPAFRVGIGFNRYLPSIHLQPYMRELRLPRWPVPGLQRPELADARRCRSFTALERDQQERVVEVLAAALS